MTTRSFRHVAQCWRNADLTPRERAHSVHPQATFAVLTCGAAASCCAAHATRAVVAHRLAGVRATVVVLPAGVHS